MKIILNNSRIDKSLININPGLNYGRFNIGNLIIDNYKIIISKQELIQIIEKEYIEIRNEIQFDDKKYNDTSEFSVINYPSLNDLIFTYSYQFQEIFTTYLDKILFTKLFVESHNPEYIINCTDGVKLLDENIEIIGRTYRKQTSEN